MADDHWSLLFYEPTNNACCLWSRYPNEEWSYYPVSHDHYANHPDMTVGQCAEGCLATEGCTGFEVMTTFPLHVEGSSAENYSPYCALWYSYACTDADSPGWTSGCGAFSTFNRMTPPRPPLPHPPPTPHPPPAHPPEPATPPSPPHPPWPHTPPPSPPPCPSPPPPPSPLPPYLPHWHPPMPPPSPRPPPPAFVIRHFPEHPPPPMPPHRPPPPPLASTTPATTPQQLLSDESSAISSGSSSSGDGANVLAIVLGSFAAILALGAVAFVAILYGPKRRSRTTERLSAQAGVALAARTTQTQQQRGAARGGGGSGSSDGSGGGGGGVGACTVSSTAGGGGGTGGAIPVAEAAVTTKAAITVQRRWRRWARVPSRPKQWRRQPGRQPDVVAAVEVVQAEPLP